MGYRHHRLIGLSASLVVALLITLLPLPARAHDGHGAMALARDEVAGPFVVTIWAVEHEVDGTLDIYVMSQGDATPRTIEVVDAQAHVTRLLPVADGAWTGVVRRPLTETGSLEIHLADDIGQRGALSVSVPTVSVPGMSLIVFVLMAHAVITLAWLLLRWPLVWGRSERRGAGDAPEADDLVTV